MSEGNVGAVVLATHETGFGAPAELGGETAALIEVGGETLAARVVSAAEDAASVGTVVLVGGDDALGADEHLSTTGNPAKDIAAALALLDDCPHAIILPGNIPFVRGAEIEAFVRAAAAAKGNTATEYKRAIELSPRSMDAPVGIVLRKDGDNQAPDGSVSGSKRSRSDGGESGIPTTPSRKLRRIREKGPEGLRLDSESTARSPCATE